MPISVNIGLSSSNCSMFQFTGCSAPRGISCVNTSVGPAPVVVPLDKAMCIDQYSSMYAISGGWHCNVGWNDDPDAFLRLTYPLTQMVPGRQYRFTFTVQSTTIPFIVDVCDDEPPLGPWSTPGTYSIEFTRLSYDATFRFIDFTAAEPELEGVVEIINTKLERLT